MRRLLISPRPSKPSSTLREDQGLGHDIEVDGIRIVATPRSPHWSAYLSTLDPEFPKTLSASLIDTPYRNLKAVPVPPRLPAWASTRRVRCNKLDLRWTAPPRECTIFFATLATALRVRGKFIHGKYKVLNTRLRCNEPPLKVADGAYAITLSGLPDDYSDGMVYGAIKANYDEPLLVVEPYQLTWKKFTTRSIRELLHDIAPVDFMTEPYEHDDGHWTACAHFKQDCDAQKAAQLIEKRSRDLPHDDVPLEADLLYTSTFKTSKEVFNHIQTRLEDHLEELGAPRMNVVCRETGTVFLGLDSPDPEEVAKCANAIEDILAGDVIEDKDGKHFWVPQLACNGPASKILKEIQQRHGVLLLPNKSKREVRYFGGSSKQMAVQEDVVRSLTADVEMRHTVDIDDAGFSWLCKTGLNLLTAVVGDKVVSLNVTSNPKKLVITGSDEEYCHVLALLEMNNVSFAVKEIRSEESCSICFTPADDPVVLGCGHTYCTECFKGLCKNGPTQADMNVTCTGAEDRCKNAIPLREIRAIADPSAFEQLLESSFSTYIARRPNQFHYCPTPDCGYCLSSGQRLGVVVVAHVPQVPAVDLPIVSCQP
ncbi:hypothetical protein NUW58_g6960 [Xylaria curta]|uniref:Uncharacterized protein n=1 Tax=Xylaria curta TaxID=42375 RepID=A0ACC1NPU0_9PEZI|nr:hypothetical protein NUW58_g6960 [Xylaria curta]